MFPNLNFFQKNISTVIVISLYSNTRERLRFSANSSAQLTRAKEHTVGEFIEWCLNGRDNPAKAVSRRVVGGRVSKIGKFRMKTCDLRRRFFSCRSWFRTRQKSSFPKLTFSEVFLQHYRGSFRFLFGKTND